MDECFKYLPHWRVLLCSGCGYCLLPRVRTWERHLRNPHQIYKKQLTSLVRIFQTYDLVAPTHVDTPTTTVPSIDGLRKHKGHRCLRCPDGLTTNAEVIRRHISKAHSHEVAEHGSIALWEECTLQTFFAQKGYLKYFVVEEEAWRREKPQPSSATTVVEVVEQQLARKLDELKERYAGIQPTGHRTQVSPWLETTRWASYLCGQDLNKAARLIELPNRTTDDQLLPELLMAFDRTIEDARVSILEDKISVFDQHRVNSFIRRRSAPRPIVSKLYEGTYRKYKVVWKRLLCCVYRMVCKNQKPSLHCTITNSQSKALDEVISAVKALQSSGEARSNSAERQDLQGILDRCCLRFCISLLDHTLRGNIYGSVVVGFLAVLGIDEKNGVFYDAPGYTTYLSAFIKMAQMLVV